MTSQVVHTRVGAVGPIDWHGRFPDGAKARDWRYACLALRRSSCPTARRILTQRAAFRVRRG
jgi:hypothetical protein